MSLFTLKTADNDQYGPVALETLRAWAREGRISKADSIYDHTLMQWIEAPKAPQIESFFASAPNAPSVKTAINLKENHPVKSSEANQEIEQEASHLKSQTTHPKLTREMLRASQASNNGNALHPTRPPSVLERIGQVFLKPFKKGATRSEAKDHKKKSSS